MLHTKKNSLHSAQKKFSIKVQMKTVMKHTEYSNLKTEAFLINSSEAVIFSFNQTKIIYHYICEDLKALIFF